MQSRLNSVDYFRAIDIFLTIFGIHNIYLRGSNLPSWAMHTSAAVDAISFVDLMFPGFLFAVGLSIPIVYQRHLNESDSKLKIIAYVFRRVFWLIGFGLIMVNIEMAKTQFESNISFGLFSLFAYFSILALSIDTSGLSLRAKKIKLVASAIALLALIYGFSSFEQIVFRPYWWGILGLIGWAHLVSWLFVLFFTKIDIRRTAILNVLLAALSALTSILLMNDPTSILFGELSRLSTHTFIECFGVMIGIVLIKGKGKFKNWFLLFTVLVTITIALTANQLIPISKIYATLPWAALSIFWCLVLLIPLHFALDQKTRGVGRKLVGAISQNSLFCFVMPFLGYEFYDLLKVIFNIRYSFGSWDIFAVCTLSIGYGLFILSLAYFFFSKKIRFNL